MEIQLYTAPFACSLAPFITLTEAKASFEVHTINFRKGEHKAPEFLKLNPKHKVPLLIVDGRPLSENVAIQVWIARTFPEAHLMPIEPWQELKAIAMLAWCSSGIHPFLSRINSPANVCAVPDTAESVRRIAATLLCENYAIAEDLLAGREFFFDHFTAVDAHFFWAFRRGQELEVDVSAFRNCIAHFDRMKARASVQKLLAFEQSVLARFEAAD